jgi:dihydroxyacid dehydratase/phosphogluconate dehydratase
LANGPIGRIEDEDLIEIIIDTKLLSGSINFVGTEKKKLSPDQASEVLNSRSSNPQLDCDPRLHADTKLWAALQNISGGTWGGCVFDTEKIIQTLNAGEEALAEKS